MDLLYNCNLSDESPFDSLKQRRPLRQVMLEDRASTQERIKLNLTKNEGGSLAQSVERRTLDLRV